MIDNLKDLKDIYEVVKNSIDRCKEPKQELVTISLFLKALVEDKSILLEKVDADYARYFYDDFTHGVLKRLIRERSNDEKYLETIASIFEDYGTLFRLLMAEKRLNHQFVESIKFYFDYDNFLHTYNYLVSEEQIKAIRLKGQTWRDELKEGDMIDALQDEYIRASGWAQARIATIQNDLLRIEFVKDQFQADHMVSRHSLDIAPLGAKTSESYEWRKQLKVGDTVDAYDKSIWNKSTILDIQETVLGEGRSFPIALVGFRIYIDKGNRQDERGNFDGYSNKFDEWIPVFSPRISPYLSKTSRTYYDDLQDIDDDFDNQFPCEEGHERVYAVPRIRKCTSRLFIHLMNQFGHTGGFIQLYSTLEALMENLNSSEELNIVCALIEMVSKPYIVYHKDFTKECFPKLISLATKLLYNSPDKFMRDNPKEKVDSLIKSIDNMNKRLLSKELREKETEVLKLNISHAGLQSSYLDRRIQGIKELNQLIRNNRMMGTKYITNAFLIEWLQTNDIFALLFDLKRTHLQIVSRLSEILKLLLQENQLTLERFELFLSLARSDYKLEVYKILSEIAYYLQPEHFDIVLSQIIGINSVAIDKLSLDDFNCLSEMAKFAKDPGFKYKINKFFWDIVTTSDQARFGPQIVEGMSFIRNNKIAVFQMPMSTSFEHHNQPQQIDSGAMQAQEEGQEENLEQKFIKAIIQNMKVYCQQVNDMIAGSAELQQQCKVEQRKKLYIVHQKFSHHDEIDHRLQFIKYIAGLTIQCKITKQELDEIYFLMVTSSPIPQDKDEFLIWCKGLCESSSYSSSILDLNEVGEFFTEKMKSKELDIKSLPQVGFDFLQHYFLSVNEKAQKLLKGSKTKNQTSKSKFAQNYFNGFGMYFQPTFNMGGNYKSQSKAADKIPVFKLITNPANLDQLDLVWRVALECESLEVSQKAINFLIKIHYQIDEDLDDQKCVIQDQLIQQCFEIMNQPQKEFTYNRVIQVIKNIIFEAEKKGTANVQPHNAVLKGELIEKIQVRFRGQAKKNNILLSAYSNTTIWDFKKAISKELDLAPKYLKLERNHGQTLKDTDNGKTLAQMGIYSQETLFGYKIYIEEEVAYAPLVGADQKLTPKARSIFLEWFKMYSNEDGVMVPETCALFIKGCTGDYPPLNDDRITGLFEKFDSNKDGKIEEKDFMHFYELSCRDKPDTVRENLKQHNIRNDLKKLSEVTEETAFRTEDMPRFKIAENQGYFDKLMEMLDRHDTVSENAWDLVQMLATNRQLYTRVLCLQNAIDAQTGKVNWTKFFDHQSDYKLLYTLQIVEAVMEEGEGINQERVIILEEPTDKPIALPAQGAAAVAHEPEHNKPLLHKKTSIIEEEENQKLISQWTQMFLTNGGIQYILQVFMEKEIKNDQSLGKSFKETFELKHIAFLLKLLRIFVMAAFSTGNDEQAYQAINMMRRSSSIQESDHHILDKQDEEEGVRFKELQNLLKGPLGEEIVQQIDYKLLQQKILRMMSQVLSKEELLFEDKLIIENSMSLWVGCVLHRYELFNEFYGYQGQAEEKIRDCNQLILHGLLFSPYEKIRDEFKEALVSIAYKLSSEEAGVLVVNPLKYLLQLLGANFNQISKCGSNQYFDLFCRIIEYYFAFKNEGKIHDAQLDFNPESLLSDIIDKIKEYNQIAQVINQQEEQDAGEPPKEENTEIESIYIGLIQLTGKIIDNFDISQTAKIVEQKSLIEEVFIKFLFYTVFKDGNQQKEIKIQPKKQRKAQKKQAFGKKSKDAAYKLINSLIRRSPLLMNNFMERSMIPLMNNIRRLENWNYSPSGSHSDKTQKYVGLRNLGCICYMNSMLQQFFMIPAFRYNLLCVDDQTKEDLKEYRGSMIDDNMLHQLQKLMAHLELSERSDYNPMEFCFAFKEIDGNPTNTGEQKDAQEFLNLAFERLENMLKSTSKKYLLQSVFGGQTCSQLVCQECGNVRNRIEDFYNLSLTVKDIKSVQESLQKLVEGEVINDYQCEGCGKKVDVSKRMLISQTPNVLIVHLQRLVFNFDTFKNDKLNNYFEFPNQLDLKPYSFYEVMKKEKRIKEPKGEGDEDEQEPEEKKEGEDNQWPEEDDCYEYKLVGTTVHSGTAQSGHYWSYINTRRGFLEPDENDPDWNKTEGDHWMEYNDSRVSDFNFEKLRDECFGDQNKSTVTRSGFDDGWSTFGSYGKSAYMLLYERKKKKPIKIVVPEEEARKEIEKGNPLVKEEAKDEFVKLIDYREGVEDIAPNQIYKQVHEDNKKFEFDNDIYSQEFFDFIKSILSTSVQLNQEHENQGELLKKVNQHSLYIGKKVILEILSKCLYNQSIKGLVEVLISIMKSDDEMCYNFLHQCYLEDNFEYLFTVMLECPDSISRLNICLLVKFVLTKLKLREKDILYDIEESKQVNEQDGQEENRAVENAAALSAKFILKSLQSLNTVVAKSWSRFEYFLDVLYTFGAGDKDIQTQLGMSEEQAAEEERIGLEFLFRHQFIGKACDFLLGRKSPLAHPNENRNEMGGAYSNPNFSSVMKLITRMINHEELIAKYPLQEMEKALLLQHDLLKVMLGSNQGGKQFGQCLANICRDNMKFSKKVAKIFVKVINASTYDNVRNYLKALKPFCLLKDGLQQVRLEWVFGIRQILTRKDYMEKNYKFGLELVYKINDEAFTYVSPIINSHNEEALLMQLLKCKGRLDTFAVNCLKEMLSLMVKDEAICRFIYGSGPPTFQFARYTDWILPYLDGQKQELERTNSYTYMRQKYDTVLKALQLYTSLSERFEQFQGEEQARFQGLASEGAFKDCLKDWWAFEHEDVIKHFPPQLIVGRQAFEENEVLVFDEDPLVTVTVFEQLNDYNFSNPTSLFNLSLPHLEVRANMYQTQSYVQYKRIQAENKAKQRRMQRREEGEEVKEDEEDEVLLQEQGEIKVRDWFENKKTESVLLKVHVGNKSQETIKFRVTLKAEGEPNVFLPSSFMTDTLFQNEYKCIGYFQKIDPSKAWNQIKIEVQSKVKSFHQRSAGFKENSTYDKAYKINVYDQSGKVVGEAGAAGSTFMTSMDWSRSISCLSCQSEQSSSNTKCERCGEFLSSGMTVDPQGIPDNYYN